MNENETMYSDLPRCYYTIATSPFTGANDCPGHVLRAKAITLEVLIEVVVAN